ALLDDLPARLEQRSGVSEAGVRFSFLGREDVADSPAPAPQQAGAAGDAARPPAPAPDQPPPPSAPPVASLSYSSLGEYERCGYRFYTERELGLPPRDVAPTDLELAAAALPATDRGTLVHALLERLDFRRPAPPTRETVAA